MAFYFVLPGMDALSQISFETLFLPDSNVVFDIAGNMQGDIFVSSNTTSAIRNNKLFKSTDHGYTWEAIFEFGHITAKSVCVNNAGEIYTLLAWNDTSETLFKSSDNGLTWTGRYIPLDNHTDNYRLYITNNDTLYVTQYSGSETKILRSLNDGVQWDTLFQRTGGEYSSEQIEGFVSDNDGVYYIGIRGFFEGQGGVFRTLDDGETWELFGLGGDMIMGIKFNSAGDLFIASMGGAHAGGLYVVYANENQITPIFLGQQFSSLVINSNDEIFAGNFNAGYLYHSTDNGQTFEWITSGLPNAGLYYLFIDQQQYIYTKTEGVGKRFYGSIEPTVTSASVIMTKPIMVFPNPCNDFLMGQTETYVNGIVDYKILSNTGSITKTGQLDANNGRFAIDVSGLPGGLYFIELLTREHFSGLFIKQ
jgi:photosystem II stability/assembly factor-like uncharacterized protein